MERQDNRKAELAKKQEERRARVQAIHRDRAQNEMDGKRRATAIGEASSLAAGARMAAAKATKAATSPKRKSATDTQKTTSLMSFLSGGSPRATSGAKKEIHTPDIAEHEDEATGEDQDRLSSSSCSSSGSSGRGSSSLVEEPNLEAEGEPTAKPPEKKKKLSITNLDTGEVMFLDELLEDLMPAG